MEEFGLIKSRVNLNRVNLGIALISDLKVVGCKPRTVPLDVSLIIYRSTCYVHSMSMYP